MFILYRALHRWQGSPVSGLLEVNPVCVCVCVYSTCYSPAVKLDLWTDCSCLPFWFESPLDPVSTQKWSLSWGTSMFTQTEVEDHWIRMGSVFCLGWKNVVKGALPLFHKQEHTHTHVRTRVLWQCLGGRDLSSMPPILAPSPWVKAEKGQRWFFGGLKIKFHMTEHLCWGRPAERKRPGGLHVCLRRAPKAPFPLWPLLFSSLEHYMQQLSMDITSILSFQTCMTFF